MEADKEKTMARRMFEFPPAAARAQALGEIHSRPYVLVGASRVILQLAFLTEGGSSVDQAVMAQLSRTRGVSPPGKEANHHAMAWAPARCAGSATRNSPPISGMGRCRRGSVPK